MTVVVDDSWRPSPSKKDTRRWCRGKVGRDHNFERKTWYEVHHTARRAPGYMDKWAYDVCSECGKRVLREAPHDR